MHKQTWIYLLFFSLLRLTNAINSSMTPPHSHMIPNAIFSAQNQNGDITIHVIAKIKIPLLLMIFLLKLRFAYSTKFILFAFKLAGGEQHFMLFADGKSTRDRRTSVARECSSLDGTKWRNILGHAVFFCWQRMKLRKTHILPIGEYRSAPFSS